MPKFRTMRAGSIEVETDLFKDSDSITSVGHFLRRFSLDELPQFYSVIIGELDFLVKYF